jgi:hypothetical protein
MVAMDVTAQPQPPPVQPVITFGNKSAQELLDDATVKFGDFVPSKCEDIFADLRTIIMTEQATSPPTRRAHELLGYAYQKCDQLDKAMMEYQAYLRLYPDESEDRTRVKYRLLDLETAHPLDTGPGISRVTLRPVQAHSDTFAGTITSYNYMSTSSGSAPQYETLSSLNTSETIRRNQYRFIFKLRISDVENWSQRSATYRSLNLGYFRFEDNFKDRGVEIGRQDSELGSLGRFDGLYAWGKLTDKVRVEVAGGSIYQGRNATLPRKFVGAGLTYFTHKDWIFSTYFNLGYADGIAERKAMGITANYSRSNTQASARAEYDFLFRTVNFISIQASHQMGKADVFMYFDRRKSPIPFLDNALSLGLQNALRSRPYDSLNQVLLAGVTTDQIYKIANNPSMVQTVVVGASLEVSKWRLTTDVTVSNVSIAEDTQFNSDLSPIVTIEKDNSVSVTGHITGTNVIHRGNTLELVASKTFGTLRTAYLTLSDTQKIGRMAVSGVVRYDKSDRLNPTPFSSHTVSAEFRSNYSVNKRITLEAQYMYSRSVAFDVPRRSHSAYIGVRYDW